MIYTETINITLLWSIQVSIADNCDCDISLNLLAVAAQDYDAYNNGLDEDIFLKTSNGGVFKGRVWPGVTAFPDWFHENTQDYWNNEFTTFFNADTGVDIDALWIDMNEPSNFCDFPCDNPEAQEDDAAQIEFGAKGSNVSKRISRGAVAPRLDNPQVQPRSLALRQADGSKKGLPGRNLIDPSYKIKNEFGILSNRTANTDLIHQGGWAEYDTHNL